MTTDQTITEFITARLDELAADSWPGGGCEGQSEYVSCARISERLPAIMAAHRAILAAHQLGGYCFPANEYGPDHGPYCMECGSGEPYEYPAEWPCPTILALAGIWSDHADYRPEWSTP